MTKNKETYTIERDLVLKILAYIINTEIEMDAEWGGAAPFNELPRYDDDGNLSNGGIKPEIYFELLEGILGEEEDEGGNIKPNLYDELSHMLNIMDYE